jgi:hypothetical protein
VWKQIRKGWAWIEWENTKEKDKPHILIHFASAPKISEILLKVIIKEKNGKQYVVEEFDSFQEAFKKVDELKKVL